MEYLEFETIPIKTIYLFAPTQVVKSFSIHSSLTFPKRFTRSSRFSPHSSIITGFIFDQPSKIPSMVSPSVTFHIEPWESGQEHYSLVGILVLCLFYNRGNKIQWNQRELETVSWSILCNSISGEEHKIKYVWLYPPKTCEEKETSSPPATSQVIDSHIQFLLRAAPGKL